jgi:hypothetical protein
MTVCATITIASLPIADALFVFGVITPEKAVFMKTQK